MLDNEDRVYLQRRYKTGYLDGYYDTPAGKMDKGEFPIGAVCREALEEAGVIINPNDLELFHIYTDLSDHGVWIGLMYRTRKWQGKPSIQEPEKCDDAGFYSFDQLPNVTEAVRDGLSTVAAAPSISMFYYDNTRRS